jgi:DNA integrity scanning protein DisA with diadenylate cyclase activity/protein-disulfide isomerase
VAERQENVRLEIPVGDRDHAWGPSPAPVTLVEYGDFECPYCGRMHPVVKELRERLGDRLRFVFRHFPLDSVHPHARRAAEAAEAAAAQGRFWEMHDRLYENQDDLDDEALKRYATELGLDLTRFEDDLAARRHAPRVRQDRLGGEQAGVEGTPTFFVNGVRHEGALDLETLLAAVEAAAPSRTRAATRPETPPDPLDEVCSERRGVNTRTLRRVVQLAVEIAREGREGRKIGTLFVVGDSEEVVRRSRPLILDPLAGHPEERKRVDDPDVRETLKELAQLDGAFIVSDEGVVLSAARYLDAVSDSLDVPLGLGSRHMAAASVSKQTGAVAVAVSESSVVRMFDDGELVSEIIPEIWMLSGYGSYPNGAGWGVARPDLTVRNLED